jgi:hypothetical protein
MTTPEESWDARLLREHGQVVLRGETEVAFFWDEHDAKRFLRRYLPELRARPPLLGHDHAGRSDRAYRLHILGFQDEEKNAEWSIRPFGDRGPKGGDAATYRGGGSSWGYLLNSSYFSHRPARLEIVGVLEHHCGGRRLGLCFEASAYRDGNHVSCSGGPIPWVEPSGLTLLGLRATRFWRFADGYPEAHGGGDFYLHVPHWLWNGEEPTT